MKATAIWFFLVLVSSTLLPFTKGHAQAAGEVVSFSSERDSVTAHLTSSHFVFFDFHLKPDWHIYWRNPGDTGAAARIRREKSDLGGLESDFQLKFPTPELQRVKELGNFIYANRAVLALPISELPTETKSINLKLRLEWLICREECIPENQTFVIKQIDRSAEALQAERFFLAHETRPDRLQAEIREESGRLKIKIFSAPDNLGSLETLYFFPDHSPWLQATASQKWTRQGHDLDGEIEFDSAAGAGHLEKILSKAKSTNSLGVLGQEDGSVQGVEVHLREENQSLSGASVTSWEERGFQLLLLAFLGGLILNLMPCVFPVISLKILSFTKYAEDSGSAKSHGLVFTLGVLVSFWFLAGLLILLKYFGASLGWGFQFQSKIFLAELILLFFLMALSFLSLFEIDLPVYGLGHLQAKEGHSGSFFSGVLAVLVATPCSAPFMGAAIGAAITKPGFLSFLIFTSLGLGMSSPYLILSYSPTLLRKLPKPGRWMEILKQILAFPMLITALWLGSVFLISASPDQVLILLSSLVALSFALWLGKFNRLMAAIGVFAVCVGMGFLLRDSKNLGETGLKNPKSLELKSEIWEKFSVKKLEELQAEKRPVFIDFTAAWCLSCQLNKKAVLETEAGQKLFHDFDVVLLKADWTDPDPEIESFLQKFDRSGIPFYPLYVPGETQPVILPEVLTPQILRTRLQQSLTKKEHL
jgi:thiol:disulfide interchange protein DsbD